MSGTSDLVRFSPSNKFLQDIFKDGADPAALIPEKSTGKQIVGIVRLAVGVEQEVTRKTAWIVPVIGRCMALLSANKGLLKSTGYATLKAFEEGELTDKAAHGTIWNAKKIYEVYPDLTIEEFAKAGPVNLKRAAEALPPDASTKQKEEFLQQAIALPVRQFTEWVENSSGLSSPGQTTGGQIIFRGSSADVKEIQDWLADEGARKWAGTTHPLEMILAAKRSCEAEIVAESEEDDDHIQPSIPVQGEMTVIEPAAPEDEGDPQVSW